MMRKAAALLLCAGAIGMHAPGVASAEAPVGAHAMLQLSNPPSFMEAMFREAAAMHASALRMDIAPAIVFGDSSGPPDFSGLDEVMALAQKYHLRVVGDLFTIPSWIANCQVPTSDQQAVRCGTDDLADYRSIISQIVSHADPVIRDWEIWNEPDTSFFFTGTPQQYARMLQTAHDSIKQIDPQANVLLGGISSASGASWLSQVFATPGVDASHDFDTANIHERNWLGSLAGDLATWKHFLAGYGFSGPLWVTEHGYPSDPAYQYDPSYTGGPASQADYLTASVPTLVQAGASEVFVTERDNLGGQFASEGLLGGDVLDPPVADPQVVEKPSYTALSTLANCYLISGRDCPSAPPAASPGWIALRPTPPGSSAAATVKISDPGGEPLDIGPLALVQETGSGLSLRSDGCSNQIIEPRQSCTASVVFAPTVGGNAIATLQVPSDQGPVTVPVTAVAPSVSSLTSPRLPTPVFKPIIGDGVGNLQWLVLLLSNPLGVPIHVSSTSISGPGARQFAVRSSPCAGATVAPGTSCMVSVRFAPTRVGRATALLTLSGEGAPLQIPLSATAFPLPRVKWIGLRASRSCSAAARPERVRVLTDQPSRVRWTVQLARPGSGPRCARPPRTSVGERTSATGRVITGRRLKWVFGHRGYLATFVLPEGRGGLQAGAYRVTVVATDSHGTGPTGSRALKVR